MKKRLFFFLVCLLVIVFILSACGYTSRDLDEAYDAGYDRGYKAGTREGIDDALRSACNSADSTSLDLEEAINIADCFLHDLPEKEDLTEEDYLDAIEYLYDFADYFFEEYYA